MLEADAVAPRLDRLRRISGTGTLAAVTSGGGHTRESDRRLESREGEPSGEIVDLKAPAGDDTREPRPRPDPSREGRETRAWTKPRRPPFLHRDGGAAEDASSRHEAGATADRSPTILRARRLATTGTDSASLLERAIALIEAELGSPRLTPTRVVHAVGTSRATLYREFESYGGIAAFIHAARLERARKFLVAAAGARGSVERVAAACGYRNTARFSRQFELRFGEKPAAFLRRTHAASMTLTRCG